MSRAKAGDDLTKFQRPRRVRRESGMKLLRLWVQDPTVPGFRDDVLRQAARLRGAPEEAEALRFIEAAADWPAG